MKAFQQIHRTLTNMATIHRHMFSSPLLLALLLLLADKTIRFEPTGM